VSLSASGMGIGERIEDVRNRVGVAAERAGRSPAEITLIAVSKSFPAADCVAALEAGISDLGENRAQELKEKTSLIDRPARWHFVGNLQTNKVRTVVGAAGLIHSVDRFELAAAIDRRARHLGIKQSVLVQVNVAHDDSKHGVSPEDAITLAREVAALPGLSLHGLMTMPPYPDRPDDSRPYYQELAAIGSGLRSKLPDAADLSMGMTRDFEVAIEEGATMVRVGEAIFGRRTAK
jgi:PLP dependent protein